ncbi:MAG: tetratricopeptide repeat protein [Clostridia bacterium]
MTDNNSKGKILPFLQKRDFYLNRGIDKRDKNDYLSALEYIKRGLSIYSDDKEMQITLATIYTDMGLYEYSNRTLLTYFPNKDDNPADVAFMMGCNYIGIEDYDAAFDMLSMYLDEEPDGIHAQYAYDMLLSMDVVDYPEIMTVIDSDSVISDKINSYYLRSNRLIENNKVDKAIALLLESLNELDDESNILRNNLAIAYFCNEDYDAAIRELNTILKKSPDDPYAHNSLCIFYHTKKDKAAMNVELLYLRGIKKTTDKDILTRLSVTFMEVGQYDDCLDVLKKLQQEAHYNREIIHRLAMCYYMRHEYSKAEEYYDFLIKLDDCDSIASYYYQVCKEATNGNPSKNVNNTYYQVPPHEVIKRMSYIKDAMQKSIDEIETMFINDRKFYSTIKWALEYEDNKIKQLVLAIIGNFRCKKAILLLRDFLLRENQPNMLKNHVCNMLLDMGEAPPFPINIDGEYFDGTGDVINIDNPNLPKGYKNILQIASKGLARYEDSEVIKIGTLIWAKFFDYAPLRTFSKERVVALAAAIDYLTCEVLEKDFPEKEAIEYYTITKIRFHNALDIVMEAVDKDEILREIGLLE